MVRIINFMETLNLYKLQSNKILNGNLALQIYVSPNFKTNEQAYYRKNHP